MPSDPTVLLRTEHAAARVLASAQSEAEAYPALLAAVAESLGWDAGALWTGTPPDRQRAARWPADAETDGPVAAAFPIEGVGVMEFFTTHPVEPDETLDATLANLSAQIGHFAERLRTQQALRESDARKSAIIDAAFDCVITMDHHGDVIEVNDRAEQTFGYTAAEMVGRELAELIVPPELRDAHRHGLARAVAAGAVHVPDHPLDLMAMRADGSEFPVEVAITQPDVPGPPIYCGYLRDVTARREAEQAVRMLAEEQAALRRVATAVATERDPGRVFGLVTEEVGRLLGAHSSNMVRYEGDGTATVVGGWSVGRVGNVPVGERVPLDGDTATVRVLRTGAPTRVDTYEGIPGRLAERLRDHLGFRCAVGAPVVLGGRLWGAVIVSSVNPEPFPGGAEQRIADFAELAAQALANAEAREELAASRMRIVEAGDEERRRLERNLHDGAQQRLVSLSLNLRMAARRYPDAREALDAASAELAQALEELRELARGIHPAILSDRGLQPALEALAVRAPLPVRLVVGLDEPLPEPVEACAYYVVAEALTNACKYAQASAVDVRVASGDGTTRIEVADDGIGGAQRHAGGGLGGLADRVEALGGRLELDSPTGAGTSVRAEVPYLVEATSRPRAAQAG
ncbi:MAG TPA: PAS domain S-box protein [Solirubrobacteraceae bacterium]|jgi:PAS domain S-box-containing protein|nr:PAS domain S-box protein [Solirubrobacteraceae bacterium]